MERSRRRPTIRMRPGPVDGPLDADALFDVGLRAGGSVWNDAALAGPFVIWVPDMERAGPVLVFAEAAGWWPASAYLPAPGQVLSARLTLERPVGRRGPVARRLALVAESWQWCLSPASTEFPDGQPRHVAAAAASLLRGVDSLAGWGMPPDLRACYPAPVSPAGSINLVVVAPPPGAPEMLLADPVRPCGGLVLHRQGATDCRVLILWRDDMAVRGWSVLETQRPLDTSRTFAAGDRIWGPDQHQLVGREGMSIAVGDSKGVHLCHYPLVDDLAAEAVGMLQPRLIFGPVRGL